MMNKVLNGSDMITQLFRERQGIADQTRTTLPQGIVETLVVASFTRFFTDSSMPLGTKNGGISLPKISVAHGTLAVDTRQGIPQTLCPRFIPWSDKTANYQARFDIQSQPYPLFITFRANE